MTTENATPTHRCSCGRTFAARIYAEDCADQDEIEREGRGSADVFRSSN